MTVPQHPLVGVSRLFALYPARLFLRGVLGAAVVFLSVWHAPAAKVAARTGEITLPTYPLGRRQASLLPRHGQGEHLSLPDARLPEPGQDQPHLPDGRARERVSAHHVPARTGRQDPRGHRQDHRPADVLREPRHQARPDRPVRRLDQRRRRVEHRPARPHRQLHAAGGRRDPAAGEGRLALGGHRRDRAHLRHEMDGGGHAAARAARSSRSASASTTPPRPSAPTTSGTAPPCRTRRASASSTR